ncbi:MAG TPA: hypothetical protein PJ993_00785 [Candidatus Saccharibacteria bacterium]|nr:hypothetical protein [Candidatus Saccharibacteria bacterium]HMT39460.1 hypothetical protein [Candidatus Saccharibacteria bacterium]
MDLKKVHGVNVLRMFMDWFEDEFYEEFYQRFPDKGMTLVVLDSDNLIDLQQNWRHPQGFEMIVAHIGDEAIAIAANGTYENVKGKLRFVLRTGMDSVMAETRQDFVRPGDFPWEGAGEHEGYIGGVSGLAKEEDWEMYCKCVDKLIELLKKVISRAMERSNQLRKLPDCPHGAKYMYAIDVSDMFPDYSAA